MIEAPIRIRSIAIVSHSDTIYHFRLRLLLLLLGMGFVCMYVHMRLLDTRSLPRLGANRVASIRYTLVPAVLNG